MRVRPTGVAAVGKDHREQLINQLETCQNIDDADVLISSDKGEGGLCHKDSLRLPHRSEVVDSHKWPLMRIGKPGHPSEFPWTQSNLPFLARESQVCEALNVLC